MSSLHTTNRPTTWEQVVGHTKVVKGLQRVVKDGRNHAFLFSGPAGVGKTTLARILANALAGGEASAANIEEIPAADHSGADAMREVASKANYRAIGASQVKAIILDEAHRLSAAAFDVLLKPIEEPPPHVYWMLCTTNPAKVPKPIVTRCLTYDLKPLKEEDIAEVLITAIDKDKLDISDAIVEAIAENSSGSPRQALVFLEACMGAKDVSEARAAMRVAGQSKEVVDLCRFLVAGKGVTWAKSVAMIQAIDAEPESIRIVLVNYLAGVAMSTKDDRNVVRILGMIECFSEPYNSNDKNAPLLLSLGQAIGLGK